MDVSDFFLKLLVILLSAKLFAELFSRLGIPSVLGEVVAGSKMVSGVWAPGDFRERLSTGVAMVPRGEVGLIFAEVGKRSKIFDDAAYAGVVFVVALRTLLAPLAMRYVMAEDTKKL